MSVSSCYPLIRGNMRRTQAENPLSLLSRFSRPPLSLTTIAGNYFYGHRLWLPAGSSFYNSPPFTVVSDSTSEYIGLWSSEHCSNAASRAFRCTRVNFQVIGEQCNLALHTRGVAGSIPAPPTISPNFIKARTTGLVALFEGGKRANHGYFRRTELGAGYWRVPAS